MPLAMRDVSAGGSGPSRQPLLERPAVQPLERHERAGLVLAVVVDAHDVLVRERGESLRLAAEPVEVRGRGEDLQRDRAVERRSSCARQTSDIGPWPCSSSSR